MIYLKAFLLSAGIGIVFGYVIARISLGPFK